MGKNKISKAIKFSFGSFGGWLLSLAIVLARAFQPNAEPMSSWSVSSWAWMTAPVWAPALLGIIFFIVWFVGYVLTSDK